MHLFSAPMAFAQFGVESSIVKGFFVLFHNKGEEPKDVKSLPGSYNETSLQYYLVRDHSDFKDEAERFEISVKI